MKNDVFKVPGALLVVAYHCRWNGLSFLAWKPHVSMYFRTRRDLLRFCSWPVKTPTGDALRAWISEMEAQHEVEHETEQAAPEPATLSAEVQATGFGPECHLDETDPNFQTRTVI